MNFYSDVSCNLCYNPTSKDIIPLFPLSFFFLFLFLLSLIRRYFFLLSFLAIKWWWWFQHQLHAFQFQKRERERDEERLSHLFQCLSPSFSLLPFSSSSLTINFCSRKIRNNFLSFLQPVIFMSFDSFDTTHPKGEKEKKIRDPERKRSIKSTKKIRRCSSTQKSFLTCCTSKHSLPFSLLPPFSLPAFLLDLSGLISRVSEREREWPHGHCYHLTLREREKGKEKGGEREKWGREDP